MAAPNKQAPKKPDEIINVGWITPGLKVWVKIQDTDLMKEVFQIATAESVEGDKVKLKYESGESGPQEVLGDVVYQMNDYSRQPDGYEDMVDMENLSEAELLYNIRVRYNKDLIFTNIGPTLLVINPSKAVPHLYTNQILTTYQNAAFDPNFDSRNYKPHVFSISAETMAALFKSQKNQAIVISGESGAGKTENTKSAMKLLTSISNLKAGDNTANNSNKSGEPSIETRIIACNPILEAFGNAKTVRNDNSSRFGKYVSLLVDKKSKRIVGATITNYLLEKSRVCQQAVGERNYHIFYILCKGATIEKLTELGLTTNGKMDMTVFEYLKKAECYDVPTFNDIENYKDVTDAFRTMNFAQNEQSAIWALVASSLLLGNLDFDGKAQTSEIPCTLINEEYLKKVSELLTLDYEEIKKAILHRSLVIQGKQFQIPRNKDQCVTARDSLAKELFNRLFNWLVKRLNFTIIPEEDKVPGANKEEIEKNRLHIGLLDIFGFEKFKVNSFEQLCINYTNEKLQQLYISYVFKAEEKEFINENLQQYVAELNFVDNKAVIELMDGPGGIFSVLDDVCKVTKENISDEPFYQKVTKAHAKNPKFTMPKMSRDIFTIIHTAKDVDYSVVGFVFKNLDELGDNVNDAIIHSKQIAMVRIYKCLTGEDKDEPPPEDPKGKGKNDKFLGAKFRTQMQELMNELISCECHFIRCLKANEEKKANLFRAGLTLMQIRYLGVLDSIKVRKDGYPIRQLYDGFYEKYQSLDPDHEKADYRKHRELGSDFRELCIKICDNVVKQTGLDKRMVIFGKTKVFYKLEAMIEFDKLKAIKMKIKNDAAKKIQKAWIRYTHRVRVHNFYKCFHKVRLAIIKIKKKIKDVKICKPYIQKLRKKKRAIKKIQRRWRTFYQQKQEKKLGGMVRRIQAFGRMIIHRERYRKLKKAQLKISKRWRGYSARKKFRKLKMIMALTKEIIEIAFSNFMQRKREKSVISIQRCARGYSTRKKYSEEVKKIRNTRLEVASRKSVLIIQRVFRGYLVRKILKRLNYAITRIQTFLRMVILSKKFKRQRAAAIKIQINVRKWLYPKKIKLTRMQEYLNNEILNLKYKKACEQFTLLGNMMHEAPVKLAPTNRPIELDPKSNLQSFPDYASLNTFLKRIPEKLKESDKFTPKKINTFVKIFDIDMLYDISSIYDESWSYTALDLQNQLSNTKSELQIIQVGECHSVFSSDCSQVYTWGWNFNNRLGRLPNQNDSDPDVIDLDTNIHRPIQVVSGNDHTLMLDVEHNLFIWGSNEYGQLGVGHNQPINGVSQLKFLPKNERIIEIASKSNSSLAITTYGRAFIWPYKGYMNPVELNIPGKAYIITAACGHDFVMLLSSKGTLYSFGDNSEGQLGHGDNASRDNPELINTLVKAQEKIDNIACGFKHVICKTSSGKVYTWGWGKKGQLGHKSLNNQLTPKQVIFDTLSLSTTATSTLKALQVNAGYRHSIVLMDDANKRFFWWGTNSELNEVDYPKKLELGKKGPDVADADIHPVKIMCSWSRSISITYATMVNTKHVELLPAAKIKIVKTLINKIHEENALNQITFPYSEALAKYFPIRSMKNYINTKHELLRELKAPKRELSAVEQSTTREIYVLDGLNYVKVKIKEKDIKKGGYRDTNNAYSSTMSSQYESKEAYYDKSAYNSNFNENGNGNMEMDHNIGIEDTIEEQLEENDLYENYDHPFNSIQSSGIKNQIAHDLSRESPNKLNKVRNLQGLNSVSSTQKQAKDYESGRKVKSAKKKDNFLSGSKMKEPNFEVLKATPPTKANVNNTKTVPQNEKGPASSFNIKLYPTKTPDHGILKSTKGKLSKIEPETSLFDTSVKPQNTVKKSPNTSLNQGNSIRNESPNKGKIALSRDYKSSSAEESSELDDQDISSEDDDDDDDDDGDE